MRIHFTVGVFASGRASIGVAVASGMVTGAPGTGCTAATCASGDAGAGCPLPGAASTSTCPTEIMFGLVMLFHAASSR